MNIFQRCLNEAILTLQLAKGGKLTDKELAQTYEVTPSALSRWRNGITNTKGGSEETLLRILLSLPTKTVMGIFDTLRKELNTAYPTPNKPTEKVLKLGEVNLTLQQLQFGLGITGGIGSGKSAAILRPALLQILQFCNEESGEYAKIGGLIIDEQMAYLPEIINTFQEIGRPLTDLVVINPNSANFRYNPIDPDQSPKENAAKLGKVLNVLSGAPSGDNAYFKDVTENIIKSYLQLLKIYLPNEQIGLHHLAKFTQNNELSAKLCEESKSEVENLKKEDLIDEQQYGEYLDAIATIEHQWLELNPNTQTILKTQLNRLLGAFPNEATQKVFCKDTNFKFEDTINEGKIIIFVNSTEHGFNKVIGVCLKTDFQTWCKRRIGSFAKKYKLNTTRSLIFLADDYQNIVSYGNNGDQTFAGITKAAKVIQIIATQSIKALYQTGTKEQVYILLQNTGNLIFLKNHDPDTINQAKMLTGLDPSQFVTKTPETDKKGLWYSEGCFHSCDPYINKPCSNKQKQPIQFPMIIMGQAHYDQIQNNSNLFLATLISSDITQTKITKSTSELQPEEMALVQSLETLRTKIIAKFPEIQQEKLNNEKQTKTPEYRMLQGIEPVVQKGGQTYFTTTQTLNWAIQVLNIGLYPNIHYEIQNEPNLIPIPLKNYLLELNPQELQQGLNTILKTITKP